MTAQETYRAARLPHLMEAMERGDAVVLSSEDLDAMPIDFQMRIVTAHNAERLGVHGEYVGWIPRKRRKSDDPNCAAPSKKNEPKQIERRGEYAFARATQR